MKYLIILLAVIISTSDARTQTGVGGTDKTAKSGKDEKKPSVKKPKLLFGVASYYAGKFHGRETASGEIYDSTKLTAACNLLPLGTWIRVTNLKNNRSVIVKTNDRMHKRMTRVVDLSQAAASKLGYVKRGLTKVKVEVLEKK